MIVVVLLSAAAIGLLSLGRRHWQRETGVLRMTLQSGCLRPTVTTFSRKETETLPPPVQRYFATALQEGQAMIASVRFLQRGLFRQDGHKNTWQPFHATQLVTMHPPGFDWDARITMAPGMAIWVRDSYALGAGYLRAAVSGLVTVAELRNTPESARGELMRYLAEAAWYPTALLPSQGVIWEGLDETSARATLCDGATTVTLEFTFGADHLIKTVFAAARPKSATESAPWLCRIGGCEERDGMRVPVRGEVEWETSGGPVPYFQGTMTQIDYEFVTRDAA